MMRHKPRNSLIFFLAFVLLFVLMILPKADMLLKPKAPAPEILVAQNDSCSWYAENKTIRGYSLEPIMQDGDEITVLRDYYRCNPVQRNDIVIYNFVGNQNPIAKIVSGIPGDRFNLSLAGNSLWHIEINGKVLKNSEGMPYAISERVKNLLLLYVHDYGGVIPDDTYLLLGNLVSGSLDATAFGLVDKDGIIGKVDMK